MLTVYWSFLTVPVMNREDADKLVRQAAGVYRTTDERFEVRQSASGWFLVDLQSTNELGQPLMLGPFATLAGVREHMPEARAAERPPVPKPTRKASAPSAKSTARPAKPPKEPARTWIDELPAADATKVRVLIRALDREGITGAEAAIRADREGLLPVVASRLIERQLDELLKEVPARERDRGRELVRRTAEILSVEGLKARSPLPRWALVEIGPGQPEPKNRQIKIGR